MAEAWLEATGKLWKGVVVYMNIKLKLLFHCPNISILRKGVSKLRVCCLKGRLLPDSVLQNAEADKSMKSKIVREFLKKGNPRCLRVESLAELIVKSHYAGLSEEEQKDIFDDVIFCFIAYGFEPDEYFFFYLKDKGMEERKSYVSDVDRNIYLMQMNDICQGEVFMNKSKTYQFFQKYYKRDAVAINRHSNYDAFQSFVQKHPVFVKKRVDLSKGDGIEAVDIKNIGMPMREYFDRLRISNDYQLEEKINQSKIMEALNESSVNTIRCNAFVTRHGVRVPFAFLKVGRKGAFVDNGGKGGILVGIDEKAGILNTDGMDESGIQYAMHPDNGIKFKGYRMPDWEGCLKLCKEITPMVKGVKAIGWDLAHTDCGWVIVEGNLFSQFIGPQMTKQRGMKKEWLAVMGDMEL